MTRAQFANRMPDYEDFRDRVMKLLQDNSLAKEDLSPDTDLNISMSWVRACSPSSVVTPEAVAHRIIAEFSKITPDQPNRLDLARRQQSRLSRRLVRLQRRQEFT
jgi:hypothetical protein